MKTRQRLGQHFLTSVGVAKSIVNAAEITKSDTVFEIGTGKGILIPFLCAKAKKVISMEIDKNLYDMAKSRFSGLENLVLKRGDGLKTKEKFTVFVSNLPYSESRKAIEWLIQHSVSRCVIMVQKEFANKLLGTSKKERKAIGVLASYAFELEKIQSVRKVNFTPSPKVDSIVLRLVRKRTVSVDLVKTVNKIFSYKRKTIQNIFKQFGKENLSKKRLEDLEGDEIIKIAQQIIK